ncbi:MAG: acyltransferase family protein [Prevotellaceae bacterium]|nr:acyltransferase family protein [Prevotellaceae bacterium]
MENNVLSKTIAYLRFPLMVGIVMIHYNISSDFFFHGITYAGETPDWYRTVIYIFSDVLPRIGVPLFFFFSGFLFFYHTEWNIAAYKRKLKSRARTLLVPYLLWNIFSIALAGIRLLPCFARFFPNVKDVSVNCSFSAIALTFWNRDMGMFVHTELTEDISNAIYPINIPLWYVRDLMIVIIFAPLVYVLVKKAGYLLSVVLGLAWLFLAPYNLGHPQQLLTAFFFFSWGAYYSIHRLDFTVLFRKLSFLPVLYFIVAAADIITREQTYHHYIHGIGILLGIVSAIIVTASLLEKGKIRVNTFLADSSFFLFALHFLIINNVARLILAPIHIGSPYFLIAIYFFIPALTILICLGLYKILKRYLPACASLLTGGR